MPTLPLYQVDAFTTVMFAGNPAAVCVSSRPLDPGLMQRIAMENNLSETAFLVPSGPGRYDIRWFTPTAEAPFCGHATLASAHAVWTGLGDPAAELRFDSSMGELKVARFRNGYALDLPIIGAVEQTAEVKGLVPEGAPPVRGVLRSDADPNYILLLESEQAVRTFQPSLEPWSALHPYGVGITAPGTTVDFVSRYFAPSYGIPEDPVTGSLHCAIAPYWAARLGKNDLTARQLSARGGELRCIVGDARVTLHGSAVTYLAGTITLPD